MSAVDSADTRSVVSRDIRNRAAGARTCLVSMGFEKWTEMRCRDRTPRGASDPALPVTPATRRAFCVYGPGMPAERSVFYSATSDAERGIPAATGTAPKIGVLRRRLPSAGGAGRRPAQLLCNRRWQIGSACRRPPLVPRKRCGSRRCAGCGWWEERRCELPRVVARSRSSWSAGAELRRRVAREVPRSRDQCRAPGAWRSSGARSAGP